jgi:type I restriction enzyme S subunit
MDVIKAHAGGSTFAEISKQSFRPIPALRPDERTLGAFGDIAGPLFRLIASNQRESRVLATLRDTLLPKLISGEIRVSATEGTDDGR